MVLSSRARVRKENKGDFSGAGTFQGGPYGFGGRQQLASSEMWPGLADVTDEDDPLLPAIDAQQDSDREQYGSLESSGVFDDKPHLLPLEDQIRQELLDTETSEPSYFTYVQERAPSDILYRDLPGLPRHNALVNKVDHVPEDEDRDVDAGDEERYVSPNLLPSPREGDRGKPFGFGRYDDEHNLSLSSGHNTDTNIDDPRNKSLDDSNDLKLNNDRAGTENRWKETTQGNRGKDNRDLVSNHIVKPVNWIKKEWGQTDVKKKLKEPDDVPTHVGHMGNLANPVKHVPGDSVDIYSNSTGYLREAAMTAKKQQQQKKVKYLPKDIDKDLPNKTFGGSGMGQTMKQYEFVPDEEIVTATANNNDGENGADNEAGGTEADSDSARQIPWTYGDKDKIVALVTSTLLGKLEKRAKKVGGKRA